MLLGMDVLSINNFCAPKYDLKCKAGNGNKILSQPSIDVFNKSFGSSIWDDDGLFIYSPPANSIKYINKKQEVNNIVNFYDETGILPGNKKLESLYGIKSEIKNPELLKKVEKVISEFCEINDNNNLFNKKAAELTINEEPLENGSVYHMDIDNDKYTLTFNSLHDWNSDTSGKNDNNVASRTKRQYNAALVGSDNPNYYLYSSLGDFLFFNEKPNRYLYNNNYGGFPEVLKDNFGNNDNKTVLKLQRLCRVNDINIWNKSYIGSKMSGEQLPQILDTYFKQLSDNLNLKFPEVKSTTQKQSSVFLSTKKVQECLKKEYGIEADIKDMRYANNCLNAVKELTNAAGDKNIFKGLVIRTNAKDFTDYENRINVSGKTWRNFELGKSIISLNPKVMEEAEESLKITYNKGELASDKIKNSIFIHEMAHWLNSKNVPLEYGSTIIHSIKFNNDYDAGNIAGRVSTYAADSPEEFCAEYVSGRMDGHKYPEITNKLFEKLWNGPKLNFPNPEK